MDDHSNDDQSHFSYLLHTDNTKCFWGHWNFPRKKMSFETLFFVTAKWDFFLHFLNSVKTTQKLNSPLNSGQGKSLLALLLNNMCPMKTNSSLSTSVSIHTLSYTPLFPQEESLMYIEVPTRFPSLMLYSRYFLLKSQSYQGSPSKEIRKWYHDMNRVVLIHTCEQFNAWLHPDMIVAVRWLSC